jgi:uncharacterized membrane-anchored protein
MKKTILSIILSLISILGYTQEVSGQFTKLNESYYQNNFANQIKGKTEVILDDKARVDIVTDTFAIEVDFAEKWAESIGQSQYYARKLNKKAGILLVINPATDDKYLKRLIITTIYENVTVWLWDYTTDKWCKVQTKIEYSYKFQ